MPSVELWLLSLVQRFTPTLMGTSSASECTSMVWIVELALMWQSLFTWCRVNVITGWFGHSLVSSPSQFWIKALPEILKISLKCLLHRQSCWPSENPQPSAVSLGAVLSCLPPLIRFVLNHSYKITPCWLKFRFSPTCHSLLLTSCVFVVKSKVICAI